jgi:small conductance mechanosensitive channel
MTGLVAAASVGQAFTDLWHKIADIGPKWLVALAVLIIAWLLARLVRFLVQKAISKTSTQGHVDLLLARGAAGLVLLAGIVVALSEVGMSFSAALATLGLASVGIGFALQGVLSNLFAGIILLIQHPFTIGDQIRVGEQEGVVENIRVRDTQVLTYDGQRVFIPNKTVFDSPIVNYSSTTTLRVDIRVPLAEDADVGKARESALKVLGASEGVLEQPEPVVLLDTDKENRVLVLRFWTDSDRNRELKLKSAILEQL